MRGADLEPSHRLLRQLAQRIALHLHELAAPEHDPDGAAWALSADLASLLPIIDVLLERDGNFAPPVRVIPCAKHRRINPWLTLQSENLLLLN